MTTATRLLALAAGASLIVAGCSATRTGQAIRDPGIEANAPIPALLNPGAFPTTPAAAAGYSPQRRRRCRRGGPPDG